MKQLIFNRAVVLSLILVFTCCFSQARPTQEKTKEIKKSYKISDKTEISISNSFGKVHVETWDKKEVVIQINIIARGRSDEKAQSLLNKININIDDSKPQSIISYKTSIASQMNTRNTESFEINYQVSMPVGNALEIKNSFGDTYLDNHSGDLDIVTSYGNLTAGNLSGDADIEISFGSGVSEIDAMEKGDLKVSFSKLDVERIGIVDMNVKFSDVVVEKAGVVDLVAKYGQITFEEIEAIEANVDFAGFEIESLHKSIDLDVDYGNKVFIGGISSTVDHIQIRNSFGPVTLEISSLINADLSADMRYCVLKYPDGLIDFNKIIKDHNSNEYEGTIGNGGKTQIEIVSKYGNVRIRD